MPMTPDEVVKVLVACEFSGIVREAFAKHGHDAWSCDLLPTEIPGKHIQGDAIKNRQDQTAGKTEAGHFKVSQTLWQNNGDRII